MWINSRSEWEAFKKKHREAIEKLNADPNEVEACMERLIKLNKEHEREGPTFMRKYLDPNDKPKKWSED